MMRHLANAHSVTGPPVVYTGRLFLGFGGTGHTNRKAIIHWIGCIKAIKRHFPEAQVQLQPLCHRHFNSHSISCKGIHLNHPRDSDACKLGYPTCSAEPSGNQRTAAAIQRAILHPAYVQVLVATLELMSFLQKISNHVPQINISANTSRA